MVANVLRRVKHAKSKAVQKVPAKNKVKQLLSRLPLFFFLCLGLSKPITGRSLHPVADCKNRETAERNENKKKSSSEHRCCLLRAGECGRGDSRSWPPAEETQSDAACTRTWDTVPETDQIRSAKQIRQNPALSLLNTTPHVRTSSSV